MPIEDPNRTPPPEPERKEDMFMPTGAVDDPGPHQRRTALWVIIPAVGVVVLSVLLLGHHGQAQRQGEATGAATAAGTPPANAGPGAPWRVNAPAHSTPGVYPNSTLPNQKRATQP